MTMTSPRWSFGSKLVLSQSTKRSAFAVANIVFNTTHPERRMAPSRVRLFRPQKSGT